MYRIKFFLMIFIITILSLGAFSAPQITIYECGFVEDAQIILDGKLNEEVWINARLDTSFFVYWIPEPGPAVFKTGLRMLYSVEGLYLGINFYDDLLEQVKATLTQRDDSNLWTDDCVEIYIDPLNTGVGYLKFTANLLGTRHDLRVDENTGLMDESWSPDSWKVAVAKKTDGHEMEVFIPWDVFGQKPKQGETWTFNLVRYRYSTGKFQGSTWSPGGNYGSPYNFGQVVFGGYFSNAISSMAQVIKPIKGDAWEVVLEDGIVCFKSFKQLIIEQIDSVEEKFSEAEWRIKELEVSESDKARFLSLKQEFDVLKQQGELKELEHSPEEHKVFSGKLTSINEQLEELLYTIELNCLLDR